MKKPRLYIFSGLPGSGKSTLARELVKKLGAAYIRIDTVEQALRDLYSVEVEGEGYGLSYRLAKDNLLAGNDVVADSVNPWSLTRKEWSEVATSVGAHYVNIEVICSDIKEHQRRVEQRQSDITNLKPPTWEEVINRDYHKWTDPRILIDTAGQSVAVCIDRLFNELMASN